MSFPPPATSVRITSRRSAYFGGSLSKSKMIEVPMPTTGSASPVWGMGRVLSGSSAARDAYGSAAARTAAPPAATVRRLIRSMDFIPANTRARVAQSSTTSTGSQLAASLVRALSVDVAQVEIVLTGDARKVRSVVRIALTEVLTTLRERTKRTLELHAL